MQIKMISQFVALMCILSISIVVVSGQDTDSLPIITAENIDQLAPINILESSYLGDLVWSDDGRWLALGTSHDGVQVFRTDNLDAPPLILPAGTDVLFHPTNDILASAGSLWNIESQAELLSYGDVFYKQFSPNGAVLFTAKRENEQIDFTVWQVATGEVLNSFTLETIQNFRQIVFSEDSSRYALTFLPHDIFATTGTPFIEVRETANADLLLHYEATYSDITDVVFVNDGQHLVFTNYDFGIYGTPPVEIVFLDIANQLILELMDTNGTNPLLSPDGKWMYLPQIFQANASLIELETRQVLNLRLGDRVDTNFGIFPKFSANANYIAIPYYEQMQDTSQQGVIIQSIAPATEFQSVPMKFFLDSSQVEGGITSLDFSADETLVAVGYSGQTVIWDIASQSIRRIIEDGGRVRFLPQSDNLLMIDDNLWDIETASIVGQTVTARTGNFSPDGLQVATRLPDSVYIVNLITNEEITLPILDDYLGQVALLDAQNDLAIFQGDRYYAIDLANNTRLLEIAAPRRFTTSTDGSRLITQTPTDTTPAETAITVHTIGADTSEGIRLDDTFTQAETITISPDNQVIFISERNADNINQSYLYDAQTGARLAHWQSNVEYVTSATFSPDSQQLLTAGRLRSEDRLEFAVVIWDIADVLAGELDDASSILGLSQRNFIAEADISFTAEAEQLIITLNDALMGDGVINGYRVEIFDWDDILSIEGTLNDYYIEHLTLESATNPSFMTNRPLIVSDRGGWNGSFDIFSVTLWDSATGEVIIQLENVSQSILSSDGNLVAALSTSHTTRGQMSIWRIDDLLAGDTEPLMIVNNPAVTDIAFSATGDRIFQQSNYGVITLGIGNS